MGTVTYFILHRVNYIASIYLAPQSGNTSSVLSLWSSTRLWNLRSSSQKLNLISLWIFFFSHLNRKCYTMTSTQLKTQLKTAISRYYINVLSSFTLRYFSAFQEKRKYVKYVKGKNKKISQQVNLRTYCKKDVLFHLKFLQLTWSAPLAFWYLI